LPGSGVINQSQSAFNHILSDVSLVVYQFEALAGFRSAPLAPAALTRQAPAAAVAARTR
jgi:ABC-type uncharacterized transport system fused permease/ATPase subunit